MTLESSISFFIAIFIFSITPGPGVFAILAQAMSRGAISCWPLTLGMALSDIVYLVLACFGLSALAENWAGLFLVIRFIGAAYLIWLGWNMWRRRVEYYQENKSKKFTSWFANLSQGFLISASNPKVILFYIAFLPSFINLGALTSEDIILLSALTFTSLMMGLMLIAFSAGWARGYFRSDRAMRGLNRVAGSIMISAGLYIGIRH